MKKVFENLINNIPDYKEFLTVDEMDESSRKLAEKYPDTVELFEMGRTRDDHPLLCLKIGSGKHNALMFGCPHPNEPIGTMLLEHFTWQLAENEELRSELDYTWYIVKSWDADGTKLNENWFKGPYTIRNYARNFFRPAGFKQVDWTFPIDYKDLHFHNSIPETKAMMELIDKVQPKFIYSLHNAGFGGVYWYLTHETKEIYDEMYNAAAKQDIPLNLGEPEAPYCVTLAPAIYKELSIKDNYDYLEKYGAKNIGALISAGDCSAEYARERWGSFTMLTELPYFYDERIKDLSDSDMLRKDAALESLDYDAASNKVIKDIMNISLEYIPEESPFRLALKAFTRDDTKEATRNMIMTNPDFQKPATVAEKFDNLLIKKFYKMLSFGMLVRMNETELNSMNAAGESDEVKKAALSKAMDDALVEFNKLADYLEENINYQVVPIKKLVSIQLECGMIMADYLKKTF